MPIEVDWGNQEETLIVMKINGKWTSEEFNRAMSQLSELSKSKSYQPTLMADLRYAMYTPVGFLSTLRAAMRSREEMIDCAIVVTTSGLWQKMIDIIEQASTLRVTIPLHFVETIDEAYALLEQQDQDNSDNES